MLQADVILEESESLPGDLPDHLLISFGRNVLDIALEGLVEYLIVLDIVGELRVDVGQKLLRKPSFGCVESHGNGL